MAMPLKTVFLDAGGTLLAERPPREEIYAEVARSFGIEADGARLAGLMAEAHDALPVRGPAGFRYGDRWFAAYIERVFVHGLGLDPARLGAVTEALFERFSDAATFRLFPGALELLDALRAEGLRVAVVSNWGTRLRRVLAGLGLAERLDAVLCSAVEELEKPDPALFRRALERVGGRADEAVHAGDHPEKDVAGARAAGLRAVLVDHAGRRPPVDAPRVESLSELRAWILERAA